MEDVSSERRFLRAQQSEGTSVIFLVVSDAHPCEHEIGTPSCIWGVSNTCVPEISGQRLFSEGYWSLLGLILPCTAATELARPRRSFDLIASLQRNLVDRSCDRDGLHKPTRSRRSFSKGCPMPLPRVMPEGGTRGRHRWDSSPKLQKPGPPLRERALGGGDGKEHSSEPAT